MTNTYTDTEKQLIVNDITDVDISTVTFNTDELYLAPDNAVYSVNNATPVNGNVTVDAANKDLSNLSTTGNAKFQATITGGASTITSSNLTANKALISNSSGKVAVSSVTSSQLGYLSTVTSNVQTQLNGKQAKLVSGTNIKTINSTSLLGSGNISVGTVTSVNNVSPVNGNVTLSIPSDTSDLTNGAGFITGITSSDVTTALGYTPYNSSNPNGYIENKAVDKANSLWALSTQPGNVSNYNYTISLGLNSYCDGVFATAVGTNAKANANKAIQLGAGTNTSASTFSVGFGSYNSVDANYEMLDGTTGLIPDARISSNIARESSIPTESTVSGWGFTKNTGTVTSVNNVSPVSGNVTLSIPTKISDLTDDTATYPIDQADALTNQRSGGNAIKSWTGTLAQYDAITTKDASTLYNITDDTNPVVNSWAYNYVQLAKDIAWTPNLPDTSYSLANYLPNDGYDYEVLVNVSITTGTTSGNNVTLYFVSPAWGTIRVCSAVTRTNAAVYNAGTALVPVLANDRNITVKGNTSSSASGTYNIYLNGYRRA